jgi:hydrogenase nickel incorporation protein HypB
MEINVVHRVLKLNDEFAAGVRSRLAGRGVTALNLISAPGSGKTALLEETIKRWDDRGRLAVIEGDPDTTLDAERIQRLGVKVTQINTEGGCHLEANLVQRALDDFDLDALDLLFIENVGNLLCPAGFDLGERFRVAMVSVTEGADKPAKYPKLFRTCDVVILNKIDLSPYVDFDRPYFEDTVQCLNPGVPVLAVSCRTGEGLDTWLEWLRTAANSPVKAMP